MDAFAFLNAVTGAAKAGKADRSVKLGTVDPAYAGPPNLPKVTFDGESAMSVRTYAYLWAPAPGERVALLPVGTTYVIVGSIGKAAAGGAVSNRQVAAQNVTSTAYVNGVVNCGFSFVAPPSGAVNVHWVVEALNTTAGFNLNSFEVRAGATVGSGTVVQAASDDITIRVEGANGTWRLGATEDVQALTPGATYNIRHMHRASAGTLVVSRRYISVGPRLT